MKMITKILMVTFLSLGSVYADEASDQIQGTYRGILSHENGNFYQYSSVTLRTVNTGDGNLKVSANVKIYFGDWNSNEFLTYEYPEVPLNILTRQVSMRSDDSDVALVGNLKNAEIKGDWYASAVGRVGNFKVSKTSVPEAPKDGKMVRMVTGFYTGRLVNENPDANLPENTALSLITSRGTGSNTINVSGSLRFYLGDFGSRDYVETTLSSVDFNFYNRYLTLKTEKYGVTIKGYISYDGQFEGEVFADGYGRVGPIVLQDKK